MRADGTQGPRRMLLISDMPANANLQDMIPNHKDRKHHGPRSTTDDLDKKGIVKIDSDLAVAALDVGVIGIREMAAGEHAAAYTTCLGSRVLDCKGCMSGSSHWDWAVLAAREKEGKPSGRNMFKDSQAAIGYAGPAK